MGLADRAGGAAQWLESHRTDLLCVLGLLAVNPVLYRLDQSLRYFPPDAVAYAELARDLIERGRFFLASWGHVDVGLVLPPVFPALVGAADLVLDDSLRAAEWVARLCFLAAVPFLYAVARARCTPAAAFTVCALLPFELSFHRLAFTPLTEASFILALAATLTLADAAFRERCSAATVIALGVACAATFATRQIGIVVAGFCLAWLAVLHFAAPRLAGAEVRRRMGLVALGFVVVAVPHGAIVLAQTGVTPFEQRFRMGTYRVEATDPSVQRELAQMRGTAVDDYEDVLRRRRALRRLVPDGREMYQFLVEPDEASTRGAAADDWLRGPGTLTTRLRDNVLHLSAALGWPLLLAILASFATPFAWPSAAHGRATRLVLPALSLAYLVVLSGFGALVVRYVEVLIPLLAIQVAGELGVLWQRAGAGRAGWLARAAVMALVGAILVGIPHRFDALALHPARGEADLRLAELYGRTSRAEPAFCLVPLDCHRIGSRFRILPNDGLEQVARYARATGVEWLLVSSESTHDREQRRYDRTAWYFDPALADTGQDILEPCCTSESGSHRLFRFRSDR